MPNPDGSPTAIEQWLASQSGTGAADTGGFQLKEIGGKYYLFDPRTGTLTPAPDMPANETVRVRREYPRGEENRARGIYPQGRTALAPVLAALRESGIVPPIVSDPIFDVAADSPEAQRGLELAVSALRSGNFDAADVALMRDQGMITPSQAQAMLFGDSGGGGGGGGGSGAAYAQLAQRQAEFEYEKQQNAIQLQRQQEQDRLAGIMNEIQALTDQQVLHEKRIAQAQGDRLAALPYATDAEYFPGLGAEDPLVALGLASPMKVSPVAFNTNAAMGPNPYTADVLAKLQALGG